ncbi:MAG: pyruvate dehydrogenase complex dihydrolipoamide acetyltransferase [Parachlamydiaceae bacterium]|nr:pyruvate dehydrogenase complex dihydrolipoamide acetyltransferase [Parachlamydiaceae bacterium]
MPFTLTMPKLSPTMEMGTIVKWLKKVGDHVNAGDAVVEIATDKATVEYEVLDSGWLREILLTDGQEAVVNSPMAIFTEEEGESVEGYAPEGNIVPAKDTQATTPEAQPKQAAAPTSPPAAGPASAPAPLQTSAPSTAPQPLVQKQTASTEKVAPVSSSASGRIFASPLAKKLASEQIIDLSTIKGSGPGGRIMKRDLDQKPAQGKSAARQPTQPSGTFEEIALTPMRKIISQRLQEAKSTIPHFYVTQTIDAEPLIALRQQLKNFETSITYNDFIVKGVALALQEHPEVNSGFNASKNMLISFKTIDIAVAVSIEGGLITPIVTHADTKTVQEISAEVKELAKRAKEGKLQPHEYQGGSFTISNMGMYGITDFQAIINPPQAAILAVSGIIDAPVVKNGAVVPGKILNLTISVDHRAIDGALAAKFMKTLQKLVENPAILLVAE